MMKTKIKLLPCTVALAFAGLYSLGAGAHGYMAEPKSRSFVYYASPWPADEIEAAKLPAGGNMEGDNAFEHAFNFPPDGKLASGNNANRSAMDNEQYPWPAASMKAGVQNFRWAIFAMHRTTYFTYYITKQDWKSKPGYGQKLTAEMFEDKPFCHKVYPSADSGYKTHPVSNETHSCNVPARTGEQKIYAVWRVRDTGNAFYQMADVKFDGDEQVIAPVADIHFSTDLLSTSNLALDGSASSGTSLKYLWEVLSHGDKVTLTNSTSSIASIRLNENAASNFDVPVKMTVTNSQNVTASKTVTLRAVKEVVNAPVAVVPTDFTVTENAESRGYSLDGSNSQHAVSYHWTVVDSGGDKFALQEQEGGAWVPEVRQAKALALIKPNTHGRAVYQLTVTGADGSTHSQRVTVTVAEKDPETPPIVPPADDFPAWEQGKTYVAGDQVTFSNIQYIAKYWTQSQPGKGDAWKFADADQATPWSSTMTYVAGNKVTYDGKTWRAAYWTLGNTPGQHAVWVAQ